MIILIAESKTMAAPDRENETVCYPPSVPVFMREATSIAREFADMDTQELAERIGISHRLASKARLMFYNFNGHSAAGDAMNSFTGDVFKALDPLSFSESERKTSLESTLIVSSMYGILRPSDSILPYRFDYDVEIPSSATRANAMWKEKITPWIIDLMKKSHDTEILDLLPAEAARCIDWKAVSSVATVAKVDFRSITGVSMPKTPHSAKLKELRGKLLRLILEQQADSIKKVLQINSDLLYPDLDSSSDSRIIFLTCG